MKKIGICGNFGNEAVTSSGQIIKTRIVANELTRCFGGNEVFKVNSKGGIKEIPRMLVQSFKMFRNCENIVMLPAQNGLCFFTPLYLLYNLFFKRRIEYVVVGGWLAGFIDKHKWLAKMLKKFDGIFVETRIMEMNLEAKGFANVQIMPNFKELSILKSSELVFDFNEPYKLCTFSRVMKEKGIEDAIEAVKCVNEKFGRIVFELDIYGCIESYYKEEFEKIKAVFPNYIRYGGNIAYDKSVDILKEYFAVLFPTFYSGEGFAGTLIDAMAAGVPVIASDWKYNKEIVVPEKTGVLISECNSEQIAEQLLVIYKNPEKWISMRYSTIEVAEKYSPKQAVEPLLNRIL